MVNSWQMYVLVSLELLGIVTMTASRRVPNQLPHETDCDKYYLVTNKGRRFALTCPNGKLFDYKSQMCKWPAYVNCTTLSSLTSNVTSTSENPATTAKYSTIEDMPIYVDFLPNSCPVDHRFELLLPHETDCSIYYECSYGQRLLKKCQPDTFFSYESQVCVHHNEADCSVPKGLARGSTIGTDMADSTTDASNRADWSTAESITLPTSKLNATMIPTTTAQVPTTTAQVPTTTAQVPTTTAQVPTTTAQVPTTKAKDTGDTYNSYDDYDDDRYYDM